MARSIWTAAHLAAMAWADPALPVPPSPRDLTGRTVHQYVRLRRGGRALRLVLSNEYGDAPLAVDRITVTAAGAAMDAPLRGGRRWEVPPGERAVGDPVPLPTVTGGELEVGCFLSGAAPATTLLHSAQRTGRHAPGDRLGTPGTAGAEPFTSLYWIAQVLVDAPASGPVVIAFGDSITRGDGTTVDRDQRYPDHLQRRLAEGGTGAAVLNAGLGGNRLLGPGTGPSMADRFTRDVLAVPGATHVIVMGGVNDIALAATEGSGPLDPDAVLAGLYALAGRARRQGIRPVLGTLTPFGGSPLATFGADGNEQVRRAVNSALTAQRDWPLADFAAAVADPTAPARLAAPFDCGDGVHPSDAGAAALADAVDPVDLSVRVR